MTRFARIAHSAAVAAMAAVVIAATVDGFAQSWAGLYGWAVEHGLHGWKAMSFPLLVDAFILVGELGLFALALEGHRLNRRGMAWVDLVLPATAAVAGWSVSLAFNVGHVDQELTDQATAAVAPVASMFGLLILLRTLHRLVGRAGRAADTVPSSPVDNPESVGDDVTEQGETMTANSTDSSSPDDDVAAGQQPVTGLESAVRAAHANGVSKAAIVREFGITRWTVGKILGQPEQQDEQQDAEEIEETGQPLELTSTSLNGHPVNPTIPNP